MRKLARPFAAAMMLVGMAAPAAATQYTYDFATALGYNGDWQFAAGTTTDPYAGTLVSQTGKGTNPDGLTAQFSAWNATTSLSTPQGQACTGGANCTVSKAAITPAELHVYNGGIGVVSKYDNYDGCGTGGCGMHQIDNVGNVTGSTSYDFVQITFNKAVTLSEVTRNSFGQQLWNSKTNSWYTVWDDDLSYGSGTTQAALAAKPSLGSGALTGATTLLTSQFQAMMPGGAQATNSLADGQCVGSYNAGLGATVCTDWNRLATGSTAATASTTWWISAAILNPDNKSDAFKLSDFKVIYNDAPTAAVPEPASWATMIAGFGFVGAGLRRRRAAARQAAAA